MCSHKTSISEFIVFEGLDGAGTTTQSRLLKEYLSEELHLDVTLTYEPTDSSIGKTIRAILRGEQPSTPRELAMLYAADRDLHLHDKETGIIKQTHDGRVVISDRYLFSSLAYQSVDLDFDEVLSLNSAFPLPGLVFYIDTPVEACISRINSRSTTQDIFENETFQRAVKHGYERAFSLLSHASQVIRLDGMLPIPELHGLIGDMTRSYLGIS